MNKKHFKFKVIEEYIIVFYKEKQLFKVSNSLNNATRLVELMEK